MFFSRQRQERRVRHKKVGQPKAPLMMCRNPLFSSLNNFLFFFLALFFAIFLPFFLPPYTTREDGARERERKHLGSHYHTGSDCRTVIGLNVFRSGSSSRCFETSEVGERERGGSTRRGMRMFPKSQHATRLRGRLDMTA